MTAVHTETHAKKTLALDHSCTYFCLYCNLPRHFWVLAMKMKLSLCSFLGGNLNEDVTSNLVAHTRRLCRNWRRFCSFIRICLKVCCFWPNCYRQIQDKIKVLFNSVFGNDVQTSKHSQSFQSIDRCHLRTTNQIPHQNTYSKGWKILSTDRIMLSSF